MSFPRYPAYGTSGVDWLGDVPAHWQVKPLKHLADFINGEAFRPEDWGDAGIPIIRIQNLNGSDDFNCFDGEVEDRYLVREGDLLFGWSGNRGTSFGPFMWNRKGLYALNQHIFRVVPRSMGRKDLYWVLKAVTAHVEDQAHGIIGMVHITKSDLGAIKVPVPNSEEQAAISDFLDRETAKIDALVEEQTRLIELLREKRQAEVSQAVTKGLDAGARMSASGVPWIGEVPAHWRPVRLKTLFRQAKRQGFADLQVLSVYRDFGVVLKDSRTDNFNKTPEDLSSYQLVQSGDLVVNKMKAWQGSLGISQLDGITSPDYMVFVPQHREDGKFLHLLLRCSRMVSSYLPISNGIRLAQWRLEPDAFLSSTIWLPPVEEQRHIAEITGNAMKKWESLIHEAETGIELLQERRSALISAAVTGKIDVRGLVEQRELAAA